MSLLYVVRPRMWLSSNLPKTEEGYARRRLCDIHKAHRESSVTHSHTELKQYNTYTRHAHKTHHARTIRKQSPAPCIQIIIIIIMATLLEYNYYHVGSYRLTIFSYYLILDVNLLKNLEGCPLTCP